MIGFLAAGRIVVGVVEHPAVGRHVDACAKPVDRQTFGPVAVRASPVQQSKVLDHLESGPGAALGLEGVGGGGQRGQQLIVRQ